MGCSACSRKGTCARAFCCAKISMFCSVDAVEFFVTDFRRVLQLLEKNPKK